MRERQHNQRTQFEIGPLKMPLRSWEILLYSTNLNSWNSLREYVISVDTVNTFKKRLYKFWSNQDMVIYDYKSDITGIGNRKIICLVWMKLLHCN